jgi:hypothetical protein
MMMHLDKALFFIITKKIMELLRKNEEAGLESLNLHSHCTLWSSHVIALKFFCGKHPMFI